MARPAMGTVTFLFSDIEGSTPLWEMHRRATEQALMRHDTILRETIEGQGGYIFKTVGDAFCAAFNNAPAALRATDALLAKLGAPLSPPDSRQFLQDKESIRQNPGIEASGSVLDEGSKLDWEQAIELGLRA